jgi:hypothetical protein
MNFLGFFRSLIIQYYWSGFVGPVPWHHAIPRHIPSRHIPWVINEQKYSHKKVERSRPWSSRAAFVDDDCVECHQRGASMTR